MVFVVDTGYGFKIYNFDSIEQAMFTHDFVKRTNPEKASLTSVYLAKEDLMKALENWLTTIAVSN